MPNAIHWTTKEDEKLRQLVCKHGERKWSAISEELCTNKGSKQEDSVLLEAHEVHGNRWTLIAKLVGGRTDNAVKNRWAALNRRKITYPGRRPKRRRSLAGRTCLRSPTGGDCSGSISAPSNGRCNPIHDMENASFGSSITSYGSLLEDLAIRPIGYSYEPYLVPNRDRITHTRPPCFTHSELDMLLAALQACRP